MDKIDTPRTNELEIQIGDRTIARPETYVPAFLDHARTLERELAAAQARIKGLEKVVSRCNGEFKAISMLHRIDVDAAIDATDDALRVAI